MSEKQKSLLRALCALMAGLVSVLLADRHSLAQTRTEKAPACASIDYIDYQALRRTAPIEGTPAEYLALAEAFLERCAARPEAGRVALQAARHALDTGQARKALDYFNMARIGFASFQRQDRLDYMTALILNGEAPLAWAMRDAEIALWLEKLAFDGLASVETIRLRDGLVYKIVFDAVDPARRESVAWLAAPFGAGFPATISLSADKALIALLKLRAGEAATGLQQLKLRRCHGQDTLASQIDAMTETDAHDRAMAAAKAYLAQPDHVQATAPGQPIATCYHAERLFIAPDPETATSLY